MRYRIRERLFAGCVVYVLEKRHPLSFLWKRVDWFNDKVSANLYLRWLLKSVEDKG